MPSERDEVFGCELMTSRTDRDGYAWHGKSRAHIVAWVEKNGPVPDGLVLDHWCNRRNCRRVEHLEPVTQSENLLRRRFAYRMQKKACQFGHAFPENRIVMPNKGVVCRTCNKEARSKWQET